MRDWDLHSVQVIIRVLGTEVVMITVKYIQVVPLRTKTDAQPWSVLRTEFPMITWTLIS
jgi:hypothetical protein